MKKFIWVLIFTMTLILQSCVGEAHVDLSDPQYQLIKVTESLSEAEDLESMYQLKLLSRTELGVTTFATSSIDQYEALTTYPTGFSSNDLIEIETHVTYQDEPEVDHMYHLESINVFDAWKLSSGDGVTVAIIDTGIDIDHVEFEGRILDTSYNAYHRQVGLEHVDDDKGHGTDVASVIAAGDNGIGIIGVAPQVDLLVIKANYDNTSSFRMSAVLQGILYAMDQEVDIINLSLGTTTFNQAFEDTILEATKQGIIVIGASGNNGKELAFYPAAYSASISVGSISSNDVVSFFSNYHESLDVVAPGHNIKVTSLGGSTATVSGTSFAAPMVSGVVALLKSYMPTLSVEDIKERLYTSATDLGDTGYDKYYGHGKINAYQALVLDEIHIYYETFGGTEIEPTVIKEGDTYTLPEDPTKLHHDFVGWYEDSAFTIPFIEPNITLSKTLYAKFEPKTYVLKVVDSFFEDQHYNIQYGSTITLDIVDLEGYTFIGLYTDETYMTLSQIETMPGEDITLYVKREVNTYQLHFIQQDESIIETHAFTYQSNIDLNYPELDLLEGYSFIEWSQDIPETMPSQDVYIQALYEVNNYMLTIQAEDNVLFQASIDYLEEISIDFDWQAPIIEGYTFVSWDQTLPEIMPAYDVTIHSIYEINVYTIEYYIEETLYQKETYEYLEDILVPLSPEKEGYTFIGWDALPEVMPSENLKVYALFEVNTYTIYWIDGENIISSQSINFHTNLEDIIFPDYPIKEGYTFKSWSDVLPSLMPAEDIFLNTSYEINTYTVTYQLKEETVVSTYEYLEMIHEPSVTEVEGYTFLAWSDTIPEVMPAVNLEFIAVYEAILYTVTLNHQDNETTLNYTIESENFNLETVSLEGHTFIGWFDEETEQYIEDITNGTARDIFLTAIFEINTYTVTYVIFDDIITQTYTYLEVISQIDDPLVENYTFMGWDNVIPETMPSEDIFLTAEFIRVVENVNMTITIKVTFEDGTKDTIIYEVTSLEQILEIIKLYEIEMDVTVDIE